MFQGYMKYEACDLVRQQEGLKTGEFQKWTDLGEKLVFVVDISSYK